MVQILPPQPIDDGDRVSRNKSNATPLLALMWHSRQRTALVRMPSITFGHISSKLNTVKIRAFFANFDTMLIWLRRQSTSLVRKRSPVRIWLSAPQTTQLGGFLLHFYYKKKKKIGTANHRKFCDTFSILCAIFCKCFCTIFVSCSTILLFAPL